MYTPTHLKRWTLPSNYAGASWPDFYSSGFGQSRDSDALERSNFAVAWERISAVSQCEETQVVRENHWAVGWVEWIAIHETDAAALKALDELSARYENYLVLDDDHFSDTEREEADEVWANCYSAKERIRYIREHNHDWGFRNIADLLGCVRGKYFAGYASELLR